MGILQILAQDNYITYNKIVAKRYGVNAAILLGALCSYQNQFPEQEFSKEQNKISEDTCLSEYEIQQALKTLKLDGIIEITKRGLPAKNYYKVIDCKLSEILVTSNQKFWSLVAEQEKRKEEKEMSPLNKEMSPLINDLINPIKETYNPIKEKEEKKKERVDRATSLTTEVANTIEINKENLPRRILDSNKEVIEYNNRIQQESIETPMNQLGNEEITREKENNIKENTEDLFDVFNQDFNSQAYRLSQTVNSEGTVAKELFDYWNSKKLRKHKVFQANYLKNLSKTLEETTLEQLKQSIDNYAEIVNSEKCFWNYVWDLQDFIDPRRKLYNRFLEGGDVWENNKQTIENERKFIETFYHDPEHRQMYIKEKTDASFDMNKELKESDLRRREEAIARKNDPNKIVL